VDLDDGGHGRVLVLNGGSSAGKTTLGRKLQSSLDGTWLLLGVDLLLWMLPPELVFHPDGISVSDGVITRGRRFVRLYVGFQHAVGI
jgi:chloramphenicol 3-O phosphotransferase